MANIEQLVENLQRHGFQSKIFQTKEEAKNYISKSVCNQTVGIGGSKTVEELGLYEILGKKNTVSWHWKQKPADAYHQSAAANVYISGANAISETGEIVNIDGIGNRLSGTLFGHEKVIFIVGSNKIEPDLERAIQRARNVAAPLNARRLGVKTPCATSEHMRCFDCDSPQRICKSLVILWRKITGVAECEVIIIDEPLGY